MPCAFPPWCFANPNTTAGAACPSTWDNSSTPGYSSVGIAPQAVGATNGGAVVFAPSTPGTCCMPSLAVCPKYHAPDFEATYLPAVNYEIWMCAAPRSPKRPAFLPQRLFPVPAASLTLHPCLRTHARLLACRHTRAPPHAAFPARGLHFQQGQRLEPPPTPMPRHRCYAKSSIYQRGWRKAKADPKVRCQPPAVWSPGLREEKLPAALNRMPRTCCTAQQPALLRPALQASPRCGGVQRCRAA